MNINNTILNELSRIEKKYKVYIMYACESGSRAWRFESMDSDYDVRFIYVHQPGWYLSLFERRDVIEETVPNKLLDISGWDIKKTLKLFCKSNPPLYEWLQSPIVYRQDKELVEKIKRLIPEYYDPVSAIYHYYHMANRNYRQYLLGEEVWVKKYFYVLRPVLACMWIENNLGPVPTEFNILLDKIVNNKELKMVIDDLVTLKKEVNELKRGTKIHSYCKR